MGVAHDPAHYGDSASCSLGAGIWVNTYHDRESGYADDCDDDVVVPGDVAYARTAWFAESGSAHWDVAHDACLDLCGCRWWHADGAVESSAKSDFVLPP